MAQPGRGSHGAAPTAAPISDKKVQSNGGAKQGDTHFGHITPGVKGSKNK
jgi:hypothetical protein